MSLPQKDLRDNKVIKTVRKVTNILAPISAIVLIYYLWQFGYF
jgi:hypothetical protein